MTFEGWQDTVIDAAKRYLDDGDETLLVLLAQLLTEQDAAKEALKRLGYGCTGTPWPEVVEEIRRTDVGD